MGKAKNKIKYPKQPPPRMHFRYSSSGDPLYGWEVVDSIIASLGTFADLVESFTIEKSDAQYYAFEKVKEELCTAVVDAANSLSSIWNSVVDPQNSSTDAAPMEARSVYLKLLTDTSLPGYCNEIKRNLRQPWEHATRDGTIGQPTDLETYKDRLQKLMPKIQAGLKIFLEPEISNGLTQKDTGLPRKFARHLSVPVSSPLKNTAIPSDPKKKNWCVVM
ncbi:uncharacterized protein A1O5_01886 [Cladophialophora psammophila CBS 110553]|uniref:Uncharacterized protein n=1 Tax=Cladophialophora psammophila CBS 110553 TaxID=1182543 RepID=W9XCY4_9EURO|nr:uncharacterized protein A1O5_01886 [Cladophialophora psammophila CBS 110553]EXJ75190.1 hypothetical protein A1O5_01886 [Cladophialophora psammophila CBS 110553]